MAILSIAELTACTQCYKMFTKQLLLNKLQNVQVKGDLSSRSEVDISNMQLICS